MGYVGLPLACAVLDSGFRVTGTDSDQDKVDKLLAAKSYIRHIPSAVIEGMLQTKRFVATSNVAEAAHADIIIICVPTPLTAQREPDLSYVLATARAIARHARPGQLIILESTTYPGTTVEVLVPVFAERGLEAGRDIFVAFSPERVDPGNPQFSMAAIPKVVGGQCALALDLAAAFYSSFIDRVVKVSSPSTAEAVKLTENIFRAVNIALVNELKIVFSAMGIDVWEVIEAAKTKPFGYMPFYPGPGFGGHCVPIDPFYLTWKARQFGLDTRFVNLAGEVNVAMPKYVISRLADELDRRFARKLAGARILILGIAYKKNVDDMRESPALKLLELLEKSRAAVDYADPYVPEIPRTREHPEFGGRRAVALDPDSVASYDAVLIATDHDDVDYKMLVAHARLVIDTRNICGRLQLMSDSVARA